MQQLEVRGLHGRLAAPRALRVLRGRPVSVPSRAQRPLPVHHRVGLEVAGPLSFLADA